MSIEQRLSRAENAAAWFGPVDEVTNYWFALAEKAFTEEQVKTIAAGINASYEEPPRDMTPEQSAAVAKFDEELDKHWPAVVSKFGQDHIDAVTDSIPKRYYEH